MGNNLLNRLIWKKQKKSVLLFASMGMFIGLFILLISIQFYFDFISINKNDKGLFQKDYIVINKKVSLLNTVGFLNTEFSNIEIDSIKNQAFVEKIGLITPNKFKVGAYTDGTADFPEFYAEMFFESVPDEFMDIDTSVWHWNEKSVFIPIVIPRDYLKLYNFGFAQSQNLPKISEEIASKAMADFIIEGRGKRLRMKGKIVGFTDRINSILVPQSFMNWANAALGRGKKSNQPSRIIVVCKDPSDPAFIKYLEDHNYEANLQQTKSSRLNTLLQLVLSAVLFIGLIITLLSFMIFVISFKLMISRSQTSIRKLISLGYYYKVPAFVYIRIYSIILLIVFMLSFFTVYYTRNIINSKLIDMGFYLNQSISFETILIAIFLLLILLIANSISILYQFKKLATK